MPVRQVAVIGFSLVSMLTWSASLLAQSDASYQAPRTEYGQPDLQGVWNFSSNTPMQRSRRFGEQEFLTAEEVEAERARVAEQRRPRRQQRLNELSILTRLSREIIRAAITISG